MSGAGTKFVSEYRDVFQLARKTLDADNTPVAVINTNSELRVSSDDIDRLIETLLQIKKELE